MEGGGIAGASVDSVDRIDTVSSVETQKEIQFSAENIVDEILKDAVIHAEKQRTEEPPCEIKNVETEEAVAHAEKETTEDFPGEIKNVEKKTMEDSEGDIEKKERKTKKNGAFNATGFLFQERIEQTIEELKNIDENIKSLTETISRAVIITTVSCFPCVFTFTIQASRLFFLPRFRAFLGRFCASMAFLSVSSFSSST